MIGHLIVPSLILSVAVVTDVQSRKIPNRWIVISIAMALLSSFYFFEFEGLKQGALAAGIALLMTLPLVLLGALGSGDMKLMFAFGLASTYQVVFVVIILSFLWAALIGVGVALLKGRGTLLLMNTFRLMTTKERNPDELQKIPYTVALLLGWATYLALALWQGAFL